MPSTRSIMIGGSAARLTYAVGLLIAPQKMHRLRLGPSVEDPLVGMTTRAFGAVHTNVALLTLSTALADRDPGVVLRLNLGCDLGDLAATLLEWRKGGLPGSLALVGSVVQSAGIAGWSTAIRARRSGGD